MSVAESAASALLVLGINHRTAPVAIREEVAFDAAALPEALTGLNRLPGVSGAVILSTCNRTELYCDVEPGNTRALADWLAEHRELSDPARNAIYVLEDFSAIRHAFEVACGLDSMVLGEPQILGQIKQAYSTSRELGLAGPLLNLLFQQTFAVAKQVRTNTMVGASPVSIASAAVGLARQIFSDFDRHTALLVGAGETIELTARHLHSNGLGRMVIANRHIERARGLALQFGAYAISLAEIPAHLAEADIVVTSTASREPLIGAQMVEQALVARKRRPMFMADLAVPRDIEPAVAHFEDVYLYTLDELGEVITRNRQMREEAASDARDIVERAARAFERLLASRDTVPLIRAVRAGAAQIRDHTVEDARRMLAAGHDPARVLDYLANTLTSRLLHRPTARLRRAGEDADITLTQAALELFGLAEPSDDDHA